MTHKFGLIYEPGNEEELVILFALLMPHLPKHLRKLGIPADHCYINEITNSYPDCLLSINDEETIKVEFELFSSNFKEHGHDPSKCDLIICWKHNWIGCPIKVLELSKVVEEEAPEIIRLKQTKHPAKAWTLQEFKQALKKNLSNTDYQHLISFIEKLKEDKDLELHLGRGKHPTLTIYFKKLGIAPLGIEANGKAWVSYYNVNIKPPELLLPEETVVKLRQLLQDPKKLWHYIKAENTQQLVEKLEKIIEIIKSSA